MRANISWRTFFILLILGIFGSIAVIPYMFYIISNTQNIFYSLLSLSVDQVAQAVITLTPVILVGLVLSKRIGFSTFFANKFRTVITWALGMGLLVSLIAITLDWLFVRFGVSFTVPEMFIPPLAYRLLAAFYSGINEELIYRLLVMSFVVFITFKIRPTKDKKPPNIGIWLGIIISAVAFGITHLPVSLPFIKLTPILIVRSMVIDGVANIVYGYLFWKKGLGSSMIAHWVTDVILQI